MTGLKILAALLGVAVLVVAYVLWPSEADIGRRLEPIDQHRAECEATLGDCSELIQFLDDHKPTSVKKRELEELRSRFDELERQTRELERNDSLERADRRRGLDAMEESFYALLRDAQDLRARLREMQSYFLALQPVVARTGRVLKALYEAQEDSRDDTFLRRSNELIDKNKVARQLSDTAMQTLARSLVEGIPLSKAALNQLVEINAGMEELLASVGRSVPEEPGGSSSSSTPDRDRE